MQLDMPERQSAGGTRVDDAGSAVDPPQERPPQRHRPWLALVAGLNALAAWVGAVALATDAIDLGEVTEGRLPFDSVVLAGAALALVVAVPLTALAWAAWTGAPATDDIALGAGVLLIGWIVVQVVLLRSFSSFQPAYLGLGCCFVAASHRVRVGRSVGGGLLVGLGAVLAASGVGLVPHVLDTGLTTTSVLSVALVLGGLVVVVLGARSALRGRRLPVTIAGCVGVVVLVVVATSVIAPAVAATHVPPSEVTATPRDRGLDHEDVTLVTADGVDLAGWYVRGGNGAAVVVLHGAGSTRSEALDQGAALAAGGYGVLLVDARGHGDSGGTAMDFGWYGDLDVAAATGFLAGRPEIDPDRIGVVGLSMGGEEALGAAATDPRIRAVVAEGATARQAADKAWLSDVWGWRGWLQERIEAVQYGITDLLSEASPPTSLRSAVARAPDTRFLLITGGEVEDESHAADHIRSGAPGRVEVWTVEGAGHTGGYRTDGDEWRRRVVAFLDENLD